MWKQSSAAPLPGNCRRGDAGDGVVPARPTCYTAPGTGLTPRGTRVPRPEGRGRPGRELSVRRSASAWSGRWSRGRAGSWPDLAGPLDFRGLPALSRPGRQLPAGGSLVPCGEQRVPHDAERRPHGAGRQGKHQLKPRNDRGRSLPDWRSTRPPGGGHDDQADAQVAGERFDLDRLDEEDPFEIDTQRMLADLRAAGLISPQGERNRSILGMGLQLTGGDVLRPALPWLLSTRSPSRFSPQRWPRPVTQAGLPP